MSRRLLRPSFFNLHDPFFPQPLFRHPFFFRIRHSPTRTVSYENQVQQSNPTDPHQIFKRFYQQQGLKSQQEKDFFKKHYPKEIQQERQSPYKVLGIQQNATEQQINEAFRKLSMKYHPKNDTSQEAANKFKQICEAFKEIKQQPYQKDLGQLSSFDQIFSNFNREFESFFGLNQNNMIGKNNGKESKQNKQVPNYKHYSQSTYFEEVKDNGKKRMIEKTVNKDGKVMKIKRQENIKQDGSKQVKETIDDGKEVKTKVFNEQSAKKQIA